MKTLEPLAGSRNLIRRSTAWSAGGSRFLEQCREALATTIVGLTTYAITLAAGDTLDEAPAGVGLPSAGLSLNA